MNWFLSYIFVFRVYNIRFKFDPTFVSFRFVFVMCTFHIVFCIIFLIKVEIKINK